MSKKFDGPSFINPEHTSFANRDNIIYQTPNLLIDSEYASSAFSKNIKKNTEDKKARLKGMPGGGKNKNTIKF